MAVLDFRSLMDSGVTTLSRATSNGRILFTVGVYGSAGEVYLSIKGRGHSQLTTVMSDWTEAWA